MKSLSSRISSVRTSIFLKLMVVFLGTCLAVSFILVGFAWRVVNPSDSQRLIQNKNRYYYSQLLVEKIGTPPDIEQAKKLAHDLDIKVRIDGPGVSFVSCPSIPSPEYIDQQSKHCEFDRKAHIGRDLNSIYSTYEKGPYRYIFTFQKDPFSEGQIELVPRMLLWVAIALTVAYAWIRWLLKPIRALKLGVERVGQGKLNEQVLVNRKDELGELANSFNQMTQKIGQMIRSKEQLLLDVSHELRSPLTRMRVALEIGGDSAKEKIRKNLNELETMISELLDSARLETCPSALRLSAYPLRQLVQESTADFKSEKPGIRVHPISEDFLVKVDPAQMKICIKNLVQNAMKYSSHQDQPVELSAQSNPDGTISLWVRDFGVGIPVNERETIFEPFYRVDKSRTRSTGGYGLGLSLCKKIVQAHGGQVLVESPLEGAGTCFHVTLPARTSALRA